MGRDDYFHAVYLLKFVFLEADMALRWQEQCSMSAQPISQETLMSTTAVSSTSISQIQQYVQARHTDLKQLEQSLSNGDLAGAQAAYKNIVTLGQNGPFDRANPFQRTERRDDFKAVGQALKAGDLAGAQQAFAALKATFPGGSQQVAPPPASPPAASGPEIIINLSPLASSGGGAASPEQITINISNPANGGEQISIGIGSQGSTAAEQVTLNLPSNSNEQIVLNLLGAPTATTGSSTSTATTTSGSSASAGLSVSA
jgi:ribosomal protein S20